MKKVLYPALNVLSDAILVTLAILAVPCSVLTAYEVPFPLMALVWAAVLIGLCLSIWMHVPKYGYFAGILYGAVLIPLMLWKRTAILYGFHLFRYSMLDLLAPDVPFLAAPEPVEPIEGLMSTPSAAVGWFVLLVMVLFGLSVAWSLICSHMILLPVIVPLPIFMLSLIYTDLPIGHWTVFLLMVYLGACLMSGGLRVYDAKRYGLVTMIVLTSVTLLGALIFVFSPPDQYEPISFEQRQEMVGDHLQNLYDNLRGTLNNRVKRTEDLTDEEAWKRTGDTIFEMQSTAGGETYLRAYSLGSYRGNAWHSVPVYSGNWKSMTALGSRLTPSETMSVFAEQSEMLYVPYGFVPPENLKLNEAYLPADDLTDYSWSYTDAIPAPQQVTEDETAYLAWALDTYTITDSAEKAKLRDFAAAAGLTDLGDNYRTALAIAQYVRANALYSTEPGKLPRGEDFVLYFLKQSKTGYCVHFASATTALLQAMDIPARYVFGYRFFTAANEQKTVTDEMAHAWTEVYCPGIGWVRVESTAGAEGWQDPESSPTPPEPSDPVDTPVPTPEATPEPTVDPDNPDGTEEPDKEEDEPFGDEETPEPTDSPLGEDPDDGEGPLSAPPTDRSELPGLNLWWLLWLLVPPALAAGLWYSRKVVRQKRQESFRQKNARAAILAMYRYQLRLERFGAPADAAERELAEEAAFSDHAMTEERKTMLAIVKKSLAVLDRHPRWKRFVYRWILFLT